MQQEYLNDADYWAKHFRVGELHETIEKLEKRIAELEKSKGIADGIIEIKKRRIAELESLLEQIAYAEGD